MSGFRKFLLRGNVVDLAVGVVIGAAFGTVVASFVAAFLTPLIAIATPFKNLDKATFHAAGKTWPYGAFVAALISFVLIAAAVYFLVVLPVNRLMDRYKTQEDIARPTIECPECLSSIPVAAKRCAFCAVPLQRSGDETVAAARKTTPRKATGKSAARKSAARKSAG